MASLFGDGEDIDVLDSIADAADAAVAEKAPPEEKMPRANPDLYGHEDVEQRLLADIQKGRLPHAIILAGLPGIGKATLAYRLARFLLAEDAADALIPPTSLSIAPSHPVFRRIASGGHADLLVVERELDEKKNRLKTEISVEAARRIRPFLQKTAAENGWRVVIVDGAEYLNASSQNAILKVLEEPPKKTLLILTTSQPGAFLPTLRSRCRLINMLPLPQKTVMAVLDEYAPNLSSQDKTALALLAEGSIGRALRMQKEEGLALYRKLLDVVSTMPRLDMVKLHDLAETLGKYGAEPQFEAATGILSGWCARQVLAEVKDVPAVDVLPGDAEVFARLAKQYPPAHFLQAREKITQLAWQADTYNLDRRQAIIGAFFALQNPEYPGLNA